MMTEGKAVDSVVQYQLHRKNEDDLMVINVVKDTVDETTIYVLNKTYNEILNHINQGKPILFTDSVINTPPVVLYSNCISLFSATNSYGVFIFNLNAPYIFVAETSDGTLVLD